jgi:hypothetical protein
MPHSACSSGAQFRQVGQQGPAHHRADAGDTLQQLFLLAPERALANRLLEILIEAGQLRRQPGHMRADQTLEPRRRGAQPVLLVVSISSSCRRRASRAANLSVAASGCGRSVGRTASAKRASTTAAS